MPESSSAVSSILGASCTAMAGGASAAGLPNGEGELEIPKPPKGEAVPKGEGAVSTFPKMEETPLGF